MLDLHTDDIFLDRYRISHTLGEGAYGRVFRARDLRLGRDIALKFLKIDDETARRRFQLEARVIARLEHPATVKAYDFGEFEGIPYMVLEYVTGKTLRDVIDWRGRFSAERTRHLTLQLLGSLAEAHSMGLVHRDLKPGNILLTNPDPEVPTGKVKVLDFGNVKVLGEGSEFLSQPGRLTQKGDLVGTLRYMPIEQLRGGEIGPSADLFSLGIIVYEVLVGEHPYWDENQARFLAKLMNWKPVRLPSDLEIDPFFRRIVEKLAQQDSRDRYTRAEDVIADLEASGQAAEDEATDEIAHPLGFLRHGRDQSD